MDAHFERRLLADPRALDAASRDRDIADSLLLRARWPDGPRCPCGSERVKRDRRSGFWLCRDCGGHVSLRVGTFLEGTRLAPHHICAALALATSGIPEADVRAELQRIGRSRRVAAQWARTAVEVCIRNGVREADHPLIDEEPAPPAGHGHHVTRWRWHLAAAILVVSIVGAGAYLALRDDGASPGGMHEQLGLDAALHLTDTWVSGTRRRWYVTERLEGEGVAAWATRHNADVTALKATRYPPDR